MPTQYLIPSYGPAKFLGMKNYLVGEISIFLFDLFSKFGFGALIYGAQGGVTRSKIFSSVNLAMVNNDQNTVEFSQGIP